MVKLIQILFVEMSNLQAMKNKHENKIVTLYIKLVNNLQGHEIRTITFDIMISIRNRSFA